ncbi:hypothetical protein [Caviibacter abscessus]|uniref:hypothetical protein n=1 Tax=Caviibacter abscessus TaxID=1766719 RepID=UPI00083662FC|nr:hypothetical protein [Caviibacter abscessus]
MKRTILPLLLVAIVSCSSNEKRTIMTTDSMKQAEHQQMMTESKNMSDKMTSESKEQMMTEKVEEAKDHMMQENKMTSEAKEQMMTKYEYKSHNGNSLQVMISNGVANLIFSDGTVVTNLYKLEKKESASGEIYENKEATLALKGNEAFVEFELNMSSGKGSTKVYKTSEGKKVTITAGKTAIVKFSGHKSITKLSRIKSTTGKMYENKEATVVLTGNKAFVRFYYQGK